MRRSVSSGLARPLRRTARSWPSSTSSVGTGVGKHTARGRQLGDVESGAPDRDRTCDRRLRRPMLYPTELRERRGAHIHSRRPEHTMGPPRRPRLSATPDLYEMFSLFDGLLAGRTALTSDDTLTAQDSYLDRGAGDPRHRDFSGRTPPCLTLLASSALCYSG